MGIGQRLILALTWQIWAPILLASGPNMFDIYVPIQLADRNWPTANIGRLKIGQVGMGLKAISVGQSEK